VQFDLHQEVVAISKSASRHEMSSCTMGNYFDKFLVVLGSVFKRYYSPDPVFIKALKYMINLFIYKCENRAQVSKF
jgi:hypothetical protein